MNDNLITLEPSCPCGRPATHLVSNGVVTLRTCYLHARKAAIALREPDPIGAGSGQRIPRGPDVTVGGRDDVRRAVSTAAQIV